MKLSLLRYKGFTLRCNPLSLEVNSKRKNASYTLPFGGERIADLGGECRVIRGKGELKGIDCIEQYSELRMLQSDNCEGILSIPGYTPIRAYFTELSATADVTADRIGYSFEFTEASSVDDVGKGKKDHIVKKGETLFDIAYMYGTAVEKLVELNSHIRRPDILVEGEKIRVC